MITHSAGQHIQFHTAHREYVKILMADRESRGNLKLNDQYCIQRWPTYGLLPSVLHLLDSHASEIARQPLGAARVAQRDGELTTR